MGVEAVHRAGQVTCAPNSTGGLTASADDTASVTTDAWAALAHDIRAALGSIAWLAEIVGEEPDGTDTRAMASQIASLAYRTAEMMGDVIEDDRLAHEPIRLRKSILLRSLLAPCAEEAALQSRRRGIEFRFDVATHIRVRSDGCKLRRIVQNLLSNAVRYTPQGGVTLSATVASDGVRISVRDTGVGIAPNEIESIFRRYYRTAAARRLERLGTGIGLATVARLSALLGVTIKVQSELGRGSVFTVTVPLSKPNVRQAARPGA